MALELPRAPSESELPEGVPWASGTDGTTSIKKGGVRLALPSDGDLYEPSLAYMRACGVPVERPNTRRYTAKIPALPGAAVLFQRTSDIAQHRMHAETYDIPQGTVDAIAEAKRVGRPVLAVGTTVVRTLEGSASQNAGLLKAGRGSTELFIRPGFKFQVVDQLITNFHLPGSTLLMLVSALVGRERLLEAYDAAIHGEYRFYSYGDAMLIR